MEFRESRSVTCKDQKEPTQLIILLALSKSSVCLTTPFSSLKIYYKIIDYRRCKLCKIQPRDICSKWLSCPFSPPHTARKAIKTISI